MPGIAHAQKSATAPTFSGTGWYFDEFDPNQFCISNVSEQSPGTFAFTWDLTAANCQLPADWQTDNFVTSYNSSPTMSFADCPAGSPGSDQLQSLTQTDSVTFRRRAPMT